MANRNLSSRNLEDHIVGTQTGTEIETDGSKVDWEVKTAEVHADPIQDRGTGRKIIARRFFFKLPPNLPQQPGHEELLDFHKKHTVIPQLWKDELELVDEPRIVAGKKGSFTIVALCQPRAVLGVTSTIYEKPELVHELLNGQSPRNNTE